MSRRELGRSNQKKTKEEKIQRGESIRDQVTKFNSIYVLSFSADNTEPQTELRKRFRSSNLCKDKKTIIAHAIGATPETEARPGLSGLLQYLTGKTGLFMTNEEDGVIREYLQSISQPDFAKAGFVATEEFTVPEGPLPQFNFSMDGYLRELGLPVQLENGTITNVRNYTVCKPGDVLTKNQATLLKQFGIKMDTYTVEPIAVWNNGTVTAL